MAYFNPRKARRNAIESILEEIAVHSNACLVRIEAGSSEGARDQIILAVKAIKRYEKLKPKGTIGINCRKIGRTADCKFCQ